MSVSRLLARPMLSAVFVVSGTDTLRNPGPRVKTSEDVLSDLTAKLGVSADPELLVKINAGAQVGAGLLLAAGKLRRLSALVLIGSVLPTTYAGHRFWEIDDPQERHEQQTHFLKNLGLLGGLVLELVDTEGAPSLGWRSRRAARRAAGAIASGSRSSSGDLAARARPALAQARTGAEAALEAGGHAASTGRRHARSGADTALEVGGQALVAGRKRAKAGAEVGAQAIDVGRKQARTALQSGGEALVTGRKQAKKQARALQRSDAGQAARKAARRAAKEAGTRGRGARKAGRQAASQTWRDAAGYLPVS